MSNYRSFLIVSEKEKYTDQPKITARIIWKQKQAWRHSFCNTLAVLGESSQPAESKGDNRLPVLAFHSKRNEAL